jgi:hypothetical protein
MVSATHPNRLSGLFAAMVLAVGGCRSTPVAVQSLQRDRSERQVSQAVVLWSEAVLNQDGMPVAQGFTAKVYLLGGSDPRPVASPGKLTIYAFDDALVKQAGLERLDPRPSKTWELSAAQLERQLKKDAIGPYYTLWLPYGPVAKDERRYTLRLSFTPEKGRRVLSEPAQVTLPGVGVQKKQAAS